MPNPNNNTYANNLYDRLTNAGWGVSELGTREQFLRDVQNPTKRGKLYDNIRKYNIIDMAGDYGTFEDDITNGVGYRMQTWDEVDAERKAEEEALAERSRKAVEIGESVEDTIANARAVGEGVKRTMQAIDYEANNPVNPFTRDVAKKEFALERNEDTGEVEFNYTTTNDPMSYDNLARRNDRFALTLDGQIRAANKRKAQIEAAIERRGREIIDEQKSLSSIDRFAQGMSPSLSPTGGGFNYFATKTDQDEEYNRLMVALHKTEEEIEILNREKRRQGGGTFWDTQVGSFLEGAWDTATDISTWDFGKSSLQEVFTELLNDKSATAEQKAAADLLMQAIYSNQMAQSSYGQNDAVARQYGEMTVEMLPFILEFVLTGGFGSIDVAARYSTKLAGKIATRKIAGEMAERGVREYLKKNGLRSLGKGVSEVLEKNSAKTLATELSKRAGQGLIRFTGETADELTRGFIMANTIQAQETASDVISRWLGDVKQDEDGNLVFSKEQSLARAIWQGEANQTIENWSEMSGEHLGWLHTASTDALEGVAKVIGGKRVANLLSRVDNKGFQTVMAGINSMYGKAGIHGLFEEIGEEYIGQIGRTILQLDDAYFMDDNGEKKNLFLTSDFHRDIWLGITLSMGSLNLTKGVPVMKAYHTLRNNVGAADVRASELLSDKWDAFKAQIDGSTNETITNELEKILRDGTLSLSQQRAIMDYAANLNAFRGFNLGTVAESKGSEPNATEAAMAQSFMDGYSAAVRGSRQEVSDIEKSYNSSRAAAGSVMDDDTMERLSTDAAATIEALKKGGMSEDDLSLVEEYVNASQKRDGVMSAAMGIVNQAIAGAEAQVENRTNVSTGTIQAATLKSGRMVYIINGAIATDENGDIDRRNSFGTLVVVDGETGRKEVINPNDIASVAEEVDAEQEKERIASGISDRVASVMEKMMEGALDFKSGETFYMQTDDGKQRWVQLVGNSVDDKGAVKDDVYVVEGVDDGERSEYSRDEIVSRHEQADRARDAERMKRLNPELSLAFNKGDVYALADNDGRIVKATILGKATNDEGDDRVSVQIEGESSPRVMSKKEVQSRYNAVKDDGKALPTEYKEGQRLRVKDGGSVVDAEVVSSQDENGRYGVEIRGADGARVERLSANDINGRLAALPREDMTTPSLDGMPKDENGMPDFDKAADDGVDVGSAWDALVEFNDGNNRAAQAAIVKTIRAKERALKTLQGASEGTAAANSVNVAEQDKLRKEIDYLKQMSKTPQRRNEEAYKSFVSQLRAEANRFNVPVVVLTSLDELQRVQGRAVDRAAAAETNAWVRLPSKEERARGDKGTVYLYAPTLFEANSGRVDAAVEDSKTILAHEMIAHYGLRELMGRDKYDTFCREVFDSVMNGAERAYFLKYHWNYNLEGNVKKRAEWLKKVGSTANPNVEWEKLSAADRNALMSDGDISDEMRAGAADEYIAHIAEKWQKGKLNERDRSIWQRIVDWFRSLFGGARIDERTIAQKLQESKQALLKASVVPNQRVAGVEHADSGEARYSVRNNAENISEDGEKLLTSQREGENQPRIRGWEKRDVEINTSDYETTDEFRRVQEECRRGDGGVVRLLGQGEYSGNVGRHTREYLAGVIQGQLGRSGYAAGKIDGTLGIDGRPDTQFGIRKNVSVKLFHDIFEVVKSQLKGDELVDLHDNYDDCICYLSEDGLSGFAINQETGYFTSVFNLADKRNLVGSLKAYLAEQGATYGDCFAAQNRPLHRLYARALGVKVVAMVDYNMDYDVDDIAAKYDNPQIAFFCYLPEEEAKNINVRQFDKDGYEEATAYVQSLLTETDEGEQRFSKRDNLARLKKSRPDLSDEQRRAVVDSIAAMEDRTIAAATLHWFIKGTIAARFETELTDDGDIRLIGVDFAEAMPQVVDAVSVARQAKVDPAGYDSPMALLLDNKDYKPIRKPINPDDVEELELVGEYPNGIKVYRFFDLWYDEDEVGHYEDRDYYDDDDDDEFVRRRDNVREVLRDIINTHWGEDCNPWCLLAGDGKGNLTEDSLGAWERYHRYDKMVAFKDGKLLAFFASDSTPQWWDRNDKPYEGIPFTMKIPDDELGRIATYEYRVPIDTIVDEEIPPEDPYEGMSDEELSEWEIDERNILEKKQAWREKYKEGLGAPRNIHKGNTKNGLYEEWWDNGTLGVRIEYKDGKRNGLSEYWDKNGVLSERNEWKDGKRNGVSEWWYNGVLSERSEYKDGKRNGVYEVWYNNGVLSERSEYKDGKLNGLREIWSVNGQLERCNYKDEQKNGLWELYWANGNLHVRAHYDDGTCVGLTEKYRADGTLEAGEIRDDNGNFKASIYYNEDGSISYGSFWERIDGESRVKTLFAEETRERLIELAKEDSRYAVLLPEGDVRNSRRGTRGNNTTEERQANDVRYMVRRDLSNNAMLKNVAEKYWDAGLAKVVNDAKTVEELNGVLNTLSDGILEQYANRPARMSERRARAELANLQMSHPNETKRMVERLGIRYQAETENYSDEEIKRIVRPAEEEMTRIRREAGRQWDEALRDYTAAERYIALKGIYSFIRNETEASPIEFLQEPFEKTMERFAASEHPTTFNFYDEYNKAIIDEVCEDKDAMVNVESENGISGTWVKMKRASESDDVERTKARVAAASNGTEWCTRYTNVSGTGAMKVIEEDDHDMYFFFPKGSTQAQIAIVPIRPGEEDQLRNNMWYTGIFKRSNGSDNRIDPNMFDAVNNLAVQTGDSDLAHTLNALGYTGLSKAESVAAKTTSAQKVREWLAEREYFTVDDIDDIYRIFGIQLEPCGYNGEDLSLHEFNEGIYEQVYNGIDFTEDEWDNGENLEILDEFWEKIFISIVRIERDCEISRMHITSLGTVEYIGGSLEVRDNEFFEELRDLRRVEGSVDLVGACLGLTSLERLQYVGGDLNIGDSHIVEASSLEFVGGQLDVSGSDIYDLQELTEVGGDLIIQSCSSDIFFNKLQYVGGSLILRESYQRSISTLYEVKGEVEIKDCVFLKDLSALERVCGSMVIRGCYDLETLESLRDVDGYLDVAEAGLISLPELEKVGSSFYTNPELVNLGSLEKVGGFLHLNSTDVNIESLKSVGEDLEFDLSAIDDSPEDIERQMRLIEGVAVGGSVWLSDGTKIEHNGRDEGEVRNSRRQRSILDTAEDISKRYMAERVLSNVKGQKLPNMTYDTSELDDVRFSRTKAKDINEKTLVAVHNISEAKLRKAWKLGGMPNPSVAVYDIRHHQHEGFGNISLLLDPDMLNPAEGRDPKTYLRDAWTPTVPKVSDDGFILGGRGEYKTDIPATIENISAYMNQLGNRTSSKGGFYTLGMLGMIYSMYRNAQLRVLRNEDYVRGTKEIKENEYLLHRNKKQGKKNEESQQLTFADVLRIGEGLSDTFGGDAAAFLAVIDLVGRPNMKEYAKQQFKIDLKDSDVEKINSFADVIKERSKNETNRRYFEAKFDVPLQPSNFVSAVVPEDISDDIRQYLTEQGLTLYTYNSKKSGSRAKAIERATSEEDLRFSIGKRRRAEMEQRLAKARPDLSADDVNALFDYLDGIDNNTMANAAFDWFAKGTIKLPEDMYKVEDAVSVARKAKVDPMQYDSPMALLNAHTDYKPTRKAIDPDTVPTLKNKKDYGGGLVVYDVNQSEESRKNMRAIIDTHWGEEANPWCLLARDPKTGKFSPESRKCWYNYYKGIQKKVAFLDGKLLAFRASSDETVLWWDRNDRSYKGIPIVKKIKGDSLGRTGFFICDEQQLENTPLNEHFLDVDTREVGRDLNPYLGYMYKGNEEKGRYERWYANGYKRAEEYRNEQGELEGPAISWHDNGQMKWYGDYIDGHLEGRVWYWYEDGTLHATELYKNGIRNGIEVGWYRNGRLKDVVEIKNGSYNGGLKVQLYEDGQYEEISVPTNKIGEDVDLKFSDDGKLIYFYIPKRGKKDGLTGYYYMGDVYNEYLITSDGREHITAEEFEKELGKHGITWGYGWHIENVERFLRGFNAEDYEASRFVASLPADEKPPVEGDVRKSVRGKTAESPDIRYSVVETPEGRSLVGVHNISVRNLQKAIKLGGIVNPSVAVIDSDKQTHRGYGDISLILRPEVIDGQDTYIGDAWTQTFPNTHVILTDKGENELWNDLEGIEDAMRDDVAEAVKAHIEDDYMNESPADLCYFFLSERGLAPRLRTYGEISPDTYRNTTDEEIREEGNLYNVYDAAKRASGIVKNDKGLYDEYEKWEESLKDRYDNRTYITETGEEATLENLSKRMNKKGEYHSSRQSKELKKVNNLEDIRAERERLSDSATNIVEDWRSGNLYSTVLDEMVNEMDNLLEDPDWYMNLPPEVWETQDEKKFAKYFLDESLREDDPVDYIEALGFDLSDKGKESLREYVNTKRNVRPTRYFETKMNRPIRLNEFAAAVVPQDTPEDVIGALEENGVPIVAYQAGNQTDRGEKVRQAAMDAGVRFSKRRKQSVFDKAEDISKRFMAERTLSKVEGQKQPNMTYDVGDVSMDDVRYSVGKKRKEVMEQRLAKARPDLSEEEKSALFDYLDTLGDRKIENATFDWFAKGTIRIPEDMDKVRQAVDVAGKAKVSPADYNSPMELLNANADFKPTRKAINPDDVPTLTNKKDYGNGITVYDVEESDDSRKNMREIIDTHWGKDCNPWCLLQGDDNGNLTKRSGDHWVRYGAFGKKVAFKDGKLLAFFASASTPQWWDRNDKPHEGLPITMKMPNDELGRSATYEYKIPIEDIVGNNSSWSDSYEEGLSKPKNIHKGNERNGLYEEWWDNGTLRARSECKDGKLNGLYERWYDNGTLRERSEYKDGKKNGLYEEWNENGTLKERSEYKDDKKNGLYEEWYSNGTLKERSEWKDGKRNGLSEVWETDGTLSVRSGYKDGKWNGLRVSWYDNGVQQMRGEYKDDKRNGLYEEWYSNGTLKERGEWKNGKWNGLYEWWYENGVQQILGEYKNGEHNGVYEEWYDNGTPRVRREYKDGKRNGLCVSYADESSRTPKYYEYKNDKQVREYSQEEGERILAERMEKLEPKIGEARQQGVAKNEGEVRNSRRQRSASAIAVRDEVLHSIDGRKELGKVYGVYPDSDIRFSVGRRRKEMIRDGLSKQGMSKEQIDAFLDYLDGLNDTKLQAVTYWWFANGSIVVPDDEEIVEQAVKVSERKQVDPMAYDSPQELIDAFPDVHIRGRRIDPNKVSTLTNKKELSEGVTVYDVDESEESRQNMRAIIDTHWGEDCNPWCLLAKNDGKLSQGSSNMWYKRYNALPKRVAFRDGKLLAFFATDKSTNPQWWDRMDKSHEGIPITKKVADDALGRMGMYSMDEDSGALGEPLFFYRGNKKNGVYEEWDKDGHLLVHQERKNGKNHGRQEYFTPNGVRTFIVHYNEGYVEGLSERYLDNGQIIERVHYKHSTLDGLKETWDDDGNRLSRANYVDGEIIGKEEQYRGGKIYQIDYYDYYSPTSKSTYIYKHEIYSPQTGLLKEVSRYDKNGDKDGIQERYFDNGNLYSRREFHRDIGDGYFEYFNKQGVPSTRGLLKKDNLMFQDDYVGGAWQETYTSPDYERPAEYRIPTEGEVRNSRRKSILDTAERVLSNVKGQKQPNTTYDVGDVSMDDVRNSRRERNEDEEKKKPSLLDAVRTLYEKGKDVASQLYGMKYFDVAETPEFMKKLGLTGDKFTIRYGVISRHIDKDSDHRIPIEAWKELPEALKNPFAITKYYESKEAKEKGENTGFRIYTTLKVGDTGYVVVGAEVKNAGRNIEVNSISTIFNLRENKGLLEDEIYRSEKITPEQASLLNGRTPHQYPTEQEFSEGKGSNVSETAKGNGEKDEGEVRNSRRGAAAMADGGSVFDVAEAVNDEYMRERANERNDEVRYSKAEARDRYEREMKSGLFQTREAMIDHMASLESAMKFIMGKDFKHVEDVAGFENAYIGANRLSSVNEAEVNAMSKLVFAPMYAEVAKLAKNAKERTVLIDYMMAKHGLERNVYMAERDGQRAYDEYKKAHPHGRRSAQSFIDAARGRDYAGLTALTEEDDVVVAEQIAEQMVQDYEAEHDTTGLWDSVRAVNDAILSKNLECGLISKEVYDNIRGMYNYYIPLRGFDETTSGEEYAYIPSADGAFQKTIKAARGRKSKADDPFANLEAMAESAVMEGNKNTLVKQRFLNFVLNHESDLVSVSDLWLRYNDVSEEWEAVFPDNIDDDDSPQEVERKMAAFEQKMEQLAQSDPEHYKHGREAANIPYRVLTSMEKRQHQVIVKRDGRDVVLTINGSPRLAQAVNGLTNPDADVKGWIGRTLQLVGSVNRGLSMMYTSLAPDFIMSNFMRDMIYSNSMVWIKESPRYAARFNINCMHYNPLTIFTLLDKYRRGKLDMNKKSERLFSEFIKEGGETGYARLSDAEALKQRVNKQLRKALKNHPLSSDIANVLGEFGRAVEMSARFAAFVTSMERGRDIDRSIYDAKEISVNFNKKGTGDKFASTKGQTKLGSAAAYTSGVGRAMFIFWNASLQGTFNNFFKYGGRNKKKFIPLLAGLFLYGLLKAAMSGGSGDGDDDDKTGYFDVPSYTRRNNIVFRGLGDTWMKVPLPIEFRVVYGMGEMLGSAMRGKEDITAEGVTGQMMDLSPVDVLAGQKDGEFNVWKALTPSFAQAIVDVETNTSFSGVPIQKESVYNADMPEWTKAYKSTNPVLVDLSAWLNDISGGDNLAEEKGAVDISPAKAEYLMRSWIPFYPLVNQMTNLGMDVAGKKEFDWRDVPLANRLVMTADETMRNRSVNSKFFSIKEEAEATKKRMKKYEQLWSKGAEGYAEKLDYLYHSDEYRRYEVYEDYRWMLETLNGYLKDVVDDDERKEIEDEINGLRKDMVERVEALDSVENGQ